MKYKEMYDELYLNGWEPYPQTASEELTRKVKSKFVWGSSVLDVGCGDGWQVEELTEAGYDAHGIDIADMPIRYCRMRGLVKCKVNSCVEMHFEDKYFNCVVSSDLMQHLDEEELGLFAKELSRILKPGGVFYFRVGLVESKRLWDNFKQIINKYDSTGKLREKNQRSGLKDLHLTIKPKGWWVDFFENRGFNASMDIEAHEYNLLPKAPPIQALKRVKGGAKKKLKADIEYYNQQSIAILENTDLIILKGIKK